MVAFVDALHSNYDGYTVAALMFLVVLVNLFPAFIGGFLVGRSTCNPTPPPHQTTTVDLSNDSSETVRERVIPVRGRGGEQSSFVAKEWRQENGLD